MNTLLRKIKPVLFISALAVVACNECPPALEYQDLVEVDLVPRSNTIIAKDTFYFNFTPSRYSYLAQQECPANEGEWSLFPQAKAKVLCPENGNKGVKYPIKSLFFYSDAELLAPSIKKGDTLNTYIQIGFKDPITGQYNYQPYDNLFISTGDIFTYKFRMIQRATPKLKQPIRVILEKSNNQKLVTKADTIIWL